jgi:tetratricopeptide (TPR) repeat protein
MADNQWTDWLHHAWTATVATAASSVPFLVSMQGANPSAGEVTAAIGLGTLAAIGSVAAGRLGNVVHDRLKRRIVDPRSLLRNHHLLTLTGHAVAAVVSATADSEEYGEEDRKRLAQLAKKLPDEWDAISNVSEFDKKLEGLATTDLVHWFDTALGNESAKQPPRALDPRSWEIILLWVGTKHECLPTTGARARLAQQLHESLPVAVRELLKEDLATGGHAFGGLLLMLLGETHGAVVEIAQTGKETRQLVESLIVAVKAISECLQNQLQSNSTSDTADLFDGFGEIRQSLLKLSEENTAGHAKTQEDLELLLSEVRNLVASLATSGPSPKPTVPTGFQADISHIMKYAPVELIGRDPETKLLNDTWAKVRRGTKKRPHVLTFVALGGEGKTSLVAKWAIGLEAKQWPACDAVLAWSFYSQGTKEQSQASSDVFLKFALMFFGDHAMANSAQGAYDKGKRLAQLIGERRVLLILDGLEPLQYPTTSPLSGQLKDQGISVLLKGLAAKNSGLCVVTTRYSVMDLKNYWQTTAPETKLLRLSKEAGVELLRSFGVKGTQAEYEELVEDVKGHALTLNLLGTYLADAHAGDIRRRDLVKLEDANAEEGAGHAFHVMDAYVLWFETGSKDEEERAKGRRAIALLRLLGLFDRPATADCVAALKQPPAIPGLTEVLVGISEAHRNIAFKRLEEAKLLTVARDAASTLVSLDTHPLLREYFARQLRTQHLYAWRAAHRRLYEHLCATTKEGDLPTLEDLQPLYQAVAHGCQAGMQQEACVKVFRDRIGHGKEAFSAKKLGAFGSDLGAIACFFESPWSRISCVLTEAAQTWLRYEAACCLSALGRLTEALEPMRAALEHDAKQGSREEAATSAFGMSKLELTLGEVAAAVGDAEQSLTYADRSSDAICRMISRTTYADALHQTGRRAEAEARFREAEKIQAETKQLGGSLLYSMQGFHYCDLLLGSCERAAWQCTLGSSFNPKLSSLSASCHAVFQRAAHTLKIAALNNWLRDIALDQLTLCRAALYEAILEGSSLDTCHWFLPHAVDGLRRAGEQDQIPHGLLTRARMRSLTGVRTGSESAQSDLDEAWEIAERGPMRLFLADIQLYRARLFFREAEYPWESPAADLAAAEKLINTCGYHRRDEELADAKRVILGKDPIAPP